MKKIDVAMKLNPELKDAQAVMDLYCPSDLGLKDVDNEVKCLGYMACHKCWTEDIEIPVSCSECKHIADYLDPNKRTYGSDCTGCPNGRIEV